MYKKYFLLTYFAFIGIPAHAATQAQERIVAAGDLKRIFDNSMVSGLALEFNVKGKDCNILHVEASGVNLYKEMMQSLAYGTVVYGKILPGGVNEYAFKYGFSTVIYTNMANPDYVVFGSDKITGKSAKNLKVCTNDIAANVKNQAKIKTPKQPSFEPLSWSNARVGTNLYDGSYKNIAIIRSINQKADIIRVKYIASGDVEPKLLSAVAQFWYVKR